MHNDCSPRYYVPWGNYIKGVILPHSNVSFQYNTLGGPYYRRPGEYLIHTHSHYLGNLFGRPRLTGTGKMVDRGDDNWDWAFGGYDLGQYRDADVERWKVVAAGMTTAWERLRDDKGTVQRKIQNSDLADAFRQDGRVRVAMAKVFATILDEVHCNLPDAYRWFIDRMRSDCEVSSVFAHTTDLRVSDIVRINC